MSWLRDSTWRQAPAQREKTESVAAYCPWCTEGKRPVGEEASSRVCRYHFQVLEAQLRSRQKKLAAR